MIKLASLMCGLIAQEASANTVVQVPGKGEYKCGPSETENKACELAESKAKQDALRTHFGELIGQKSLLECDAQSQRDTGNDCELFESTWSLLNSNGYIKGIGNKNQETDATARVCTFSATFEIEEFTGKPDAGFQTEIRLQNGSTLRETDSPIIIIESNQPAFHYVFFWAPYHDKEKYYRLFPNQVDKQHLAAEEMTIPSQYKSKKYDIEVSLPEKMSVSREYLILLSFKNRIDNSPESISEANLFQWLNEKDRSNWTQDKISYRIIGDSI